MDLMHSRSRRWSRAAIAAAGVTLTSYLLVAYAILPWLWWEHERNWHPALDSIPKVTYNADRIPGDPLNVGLIGHKRELVLAMLASGWRPADPITFDSSLKIAESVLFHRPDPEAPVSSLYVFERKQDLAFEREVGSSANRRHHVRWWQARELDDNDNPLWIGNASFDMGSGLSHLTGQITHHISPDVDAERNRLMADLAKAGHIQQQFQVTGVGPTQDGRNAEGDRYYTDGLVTVGVLPQEKTFAKTPAPGSGG